MTERLSTLLTRAADDVPVPPPPAAEVLSRGRSLRRRHHALVGAAALATAAVVGGTALTLGGGGQTRAVPTEDVRSQPVWAFERTVFHDGPGSGVQIDDKAVKSLFYTSAGVLVRHGDNPNSDGGGPQRFTLVTPDGELRRLGLVSEETVHASDPAQPYVVFAEVVEGGVDAVVYDVARDAEEARIRVPGATEGWAPVSLDGDHLYVQAGYEGAVVDIAWRTGEVTPSELDSAWRVTGGRQAADGRVVDVATGEAILTTGPATLDLAPGGRFVSVTPEPDCGEGIAEEGVCVLDEMEEGVVEVHDLEDGSHFELEGAPYDWGWTADGDPFRLDGTTLTTCDADTGTCADEEVELPDFTPAKEREVCQEQKNRRGKVVGTMCWTEGGEGPSIRLGGRLYES